MSLGRRVLSVLFALAIVAAGQPWAAEQVAPLPIALAQSSGPATTYYVTERTNRGIARVDLDANGHATVQANYVLNLPPAGPDSILYDHEGHLIISNTDAGTLSEIDPASRSVTRLTINTTPIPSVADLALDPQSDIVWAIQWTNTGVARVDLPTGNTTIFHPTGVTNLGGIAISPSGRLFVSSHTGAVFELDPTDAHVLRSVTVSNAAPDGMTFDPTTGHLFATECQGAICEFGVGTDSQPDLQLVTLHHNVNGDGIAADGQGHLIVVAGNALSRLDLATGVTSIIASGIPSADDVTPAVGAGGPASQCSTPASGQSMLQIASIGAPRALSLPATVTSRDPAAEYRDTSKPKTSTATPTRTPGLTEGGCPLFPITLSAHALDGVHPGDVRNIPRGDEAAGFDWLTWAGNSSERVLAHSLTPPGDSQTYVNPFDPHDHVVSLGDWVRARPGVANSADVRAALDRLKTVDIIVPVWGERREQSETERQAQMDAARIAQSEADRLEHGDEGDGRLLYRVATFERIRLVSYRLPGEADDEHAGDGQARTQPQWGDHHEDDQGSITIRFLGEAPCGLTTATTPTPTRTATPSPSSSPTATTTPTPTTTSTAAPAATATSTPTQTATATPTGTAAATDTATQTATSTATQTATATPTATPTATGTAAATDTATPTPTPTATGTATATQTATDTATPTPTPIATGTATATQTATDTPMATPTPTGTAAATDTATPTQTATRIGAATSTGTATETPTATSTATGTPAPPTIVVLDLCATAQGEPLIVPAPGVLANASNPAGGALTAVVDSSPTHGTLSLHPDGSFIYTPDTVFSGTDHFTFHATDGLRNSNSATVTLLVFPGPTPTPTASVTPTHTATPTNTPEPPASLLLYDALDGSTAGTPHNVTFDSTDFQSGTGSAAFGSGATPSCIIEASTPHLLHATLDFWFKPATSIAGSLPARQGIAGFSGSSDPAVNGGNWDKDLYLDTDGSLGWYIFQPGSSILHSTTRTWSSTTWHHVTASVDLDGQKLWVDGTLEAHSASAINSASVTPYFLALGCAPDFTGTRAQFFGKIDEVQLFNGSVPPAAASPTFTPTPTVGPTHTSTPTLTLTPTATRTVTPTHTVTPTLVPRKPTISFTSPADGALVSAPVAVQATIAAPTGETVASWALTYHPSGTTADVALANGIGTPPATLATFDTTLLPNGSYVLTLNAVASGGGSQTAFVTVAARGDLKLGRFRKSFDDLTASVAGFQMQVRRTYDSVDKTVGDFGVGWHVELANIRVEPNRALGQGGWSFGFVRCGLFTCSTSTNASARFVTVIYPDGRTEVFDFTPKPGSGLISNVRVNFTARPNTGTTSKLEALDNSILLIGNDGNLYTDFFSGISFDPQHFRLTTADGKVLLLDRTLGLTSETDRNGNSLTIDAAGVHSSSGTSITFTRDSLGRITTTAGPTGESLAYAYSVAGDLATTRDGAANLTSFSYDASHRLLQVIGPGGPYQTMAYDSGGRLASVTDANGNTATITDDVVGRQQVLHDFGGRLTTVVSYDDRGNVTRRDQIVGARTLTSSYAYDANGNVLTKTDPLGNTVTLAYDLRGRPVSVTDADHRTVSITRNNFGQPTSSITPDGRTFFTASYDANGNVIRVSSADGSAMSSAYDARGNPIVETDPLGQVTRRAYDALGHPTSVTDPAGNTTLQAYDASGRLTTSTNALGSATNFTYDGAGHMIRITDPAGRTQSFTYNFLGEVTSATDPGGRTTTYQYDGAGNQVRRSDRNGDQTQYTYGASGDLLSERLPSGATIAYIYDPLHQMTSMSNPDVQIQFAYDDAGRLVSKSSAGTSSSPQPAVTLSYAYSAAGLRTSMTGPDGTTAYAYDTAGRLATLTAPAQGAFQLGYDTMDRFISLTRPNGVSDAMTYDRAGRLVQKSTTLGGNTPSRLSYAYDVAGRRSSLTDLSGTSTYTYDAIGELVAASHPSTSAIANEAYTYDQAGNRTSSGSTYDGQGRLIGDARFTYTYDNEGNVVANIDRASGGVTRFNWNADHQLLSVRHADGTSDSYRYDPRGQRIETNARGAISRYVWDEANIHLEYDGNNVLQAAYVTAAGMGGLLGMTRGSANFYPVQDALQTITTQLDAAGQVAATYTYDSFGTPAATNPSTPPSAFGFAGLQLDGSTGLEYARARYYNPGTGRFLSEDPVVAVNAYSYANNNPVNLTDPSGLTADEDSVVRTEVATRTRLVAGKLGAEGQALVQEAFIATQEGRWAALSRGLLNLARSPGGKALLLAAAEYACAMAGRFAAEFFTSNNDPDLRIFQQLCSTFRSYSSFNGGPG